MDTKNSFPDEQLALSLGREFAPPQNELDVLGEQRFVGPDRSLVVQYLAASVPVALAAVTYTSPAALVHSPAPHYRVAGGTNELVLDAASLYPHTSRTSTGRPAAQRETQATQANTAGIGHEVRHEVHAGITFDGLEDEWGLARGTVQAMNRNVAPRALQIGHDIMVPDQNARQSLVGFDNWYRNEHGSVWANTLGAPTPEDGNGVMFRTDAGNIEVGMVRSVWKNRQGARMITTDLGDYPLANVILSGALPGEHGTAFHPQLPFGSESTADINRTSPAAPHTLAQQTTRERSISDDNPGPGTVPTFGFLQPYAPTLPTTGEHPAAPSHPSQSPEAAAAARQQHVRNQIVGAAEQLYNDHPGSGMWESLMQYAHVNSYTPWCAILVSRAFEIAHHPLPGGDPADTSLHIRAANLPGSSSINQLTLQQVFQEHGTFWDYSPGARIPEAGDVVFLSNHGNGLIDHVGIVVHMDRKTGSITFIAGDDGNTYTLNRDTYDINHNSNYIAAFGSLFHHDHKSHGAGQPSHTHHSAPASPQPQFPVLGNGGDGGSAAGIVWPGVTGPAPEHPGQQPESGSGPGYAGEVWRSGEKPPYSIEMFSVQLLKALAAKMNVPESHVLTEEHVFAMVAWIYGEGGDIKNHDRWNPLNTSINKPQLIRGEHSPIGKQSYKSFDDGVTATVLNILDPYQTRIAHILADPHSTAEQVLEAIANYQDYPGNYEWAGIPSQTYLYRLEIRLDEILKYYPLKASLIFSPGDHDDLHIPPKDLIYSSPHAIYVQVPNIVYPTRLQHPAKTHGSSAQHAHRTAASTTSIHTLPGLTAHRLQPSTPPNSGNQAGSHSQ